MKLVIRRDDVDMDMLIDPTDTIGKVKDLLAVCCDLPADEQALLCNGLDLVDSAKLSQVVWRSPYSPSFLLIRVSFCP